MLADLPILLALPGLLLVAAFCSAAETGLLGLTFHDRQRLRRISPHAAAATDFLIARPGTLLVAILLTNNVASVLYFVLSSILLLKAGASTYGLIVKITGLFGMIILGEVLPKLLAESSRVDFCRLFSRPLLLVYKLLLPPVTLIQTLVLSPLARLIQPASAGDAANLTVDELSQLVTLGVAEGAIDADEQRMLAQVVRLGTARIKEIMTPRVRVRWLDPDAAPAQIADLVRETRFTRVPVSRTRSEGLHDPVGILVTKRYLAAHASGQTPRLADFLEPIRYVPETARLDQLLDHFRATHSQMALCVDEHGAIVGLVQIEDVVARLVSELGQEQTEARIDGQTAQDQVRMIALGTWEVPGRLSVRDWAEMFGARGRLMEIDPRITTVAGLVQARLGRIPAPGDTLRIGGLRITVLEVESNAIRRLQVALVGSPSSRPASATSPEAAP